MKILLIAMMLFFLWFIIAMAYIAFGLLIVIPLLAIFKKKKWADRLGDAYLRIGSYIMLKSINDDD